MEAADSQPFASQSVLAFSGTIDAIRRVMTQDAVQLTPRAREAICEALKPL